MHTNKELESLSNFNHNITGRWEMNKKIISEFKDLKDKIKDLTKRVDHLESINPDIRTGGSKTVAMKKNDLLEIRSALSITVLVTFAASICYGFVYEWLNEIFKYDINQKPYINTVIFISFMITLIMSYQQGKIEGKIK